MLKDLEIDLPANLPINKDDLFCFSFNFENLIKTIDYLHKYNLALYSKLQNLNERMSKFESETSEELKKVKSVTDENKSKIEKFDGKLNEANNDIVELKKDIIKNEEKLDLILTYENENNKNNENGEEEENKKSENAKINIQKLLSENAFKKADDNEIDLLKYNVSKINDKIKEIETNINNNQNLLSNQMENNLSSIINSLEANNTGEGVDPNLLNVIVSHIDKEKQNNQIIFNKFNTNQEKLKQEVTSLHNKFLENKNNFNSVKNLLDEYSKNKDNFLTFRDIKDLTKNIDMISSKLKEFSKKQDLESLKKDMNSKIQQISGKMKKEIIIQKDDKNGTIEELGESDPNVNKNISELITDLLKSEGKNIDISKNKHFVELMKLNKQNNKELNKNLRSFFDLKNKISSDHTQNEISELRTEYIDLNEEFKVYKNKLLNVIKMIGEYESKKEDDEEDEKEGKNDGMNVEKKLKQTEETITGKIEFLIQCVEKLNDKYEKLDKKLGSITKEVKDDIKATIRLDTYKVVEQFKLKLNSFTEKFENELKNKIDKMGLNIFENKLNNKLSLNLKDKLNKNDLKKNNYIISKKIDTLENKISKTLVDTIIDLQMDDAPLIVKKNQRNVELCVSCNRPLETISKTIEQIPLTTTPNINITKTPRTQIKNMVSLKKLPVISTPK